VKLVKYLPAHGWEAAVVCGHPDDLRTRDEGLLRDVPPSTPVSRVKLPPRRLVGDPGFRWLPGLTRRAGELASRWGAEVLLLTGWPFLSFLAGPYLKLKLGLPYVLDFRDPWCIGRWDPRPPGWKSVAMGSLSRVVEAMSVRGAAACTFASPGVRENYLDAYPALRRERTAAIPNGYDEAEFPDAGERPAPPPERDKLRLVHAGTWAVFRTPEVLLQGIARFREQRPDLAQRFEAFFPGDSNDDWTSLASSLGLDGVVRFAPYMPHDDCLEVVRNADMLWLDNGPWPSYVAGKIFEYLATGRPILAAASPDGEASRWLREAGTATLVTREPEGIAAAIADQVEGLLAGRRPAPVREAVRRFGRRRLAGAFADVLAAAASEC
jgi:glycosyltransferase involved in cell wall biosynthesis